MTEKTNEPSGIIDRLFSAGAHFGFSKSRRHPSVTPFLYGSKGGVEIFDLEQTKEQLEAARAYVAKLAKEGKIILFVGSKDEISDIVRQTAVELGMPYVDGRWIGGTLTNFSEIQKRTELLQKLLSEREDGTLLKKYTKLERLMIDRDIESLEEMFGGIKEMEKLPAALLVIDTRAEDIAVAEAKKLGIPVVALMGSDCDVDSAAYPVLANDSSRHTVELFLNEMKAAYQEHKAAIPQKEEEAGA